MVNKAQNAVSNATQTETVTSNATETTMDEARRILSGINWIYQ